MKFSELKNKFKNKYAIRVIAGVLMVAMLGTSYGVWQVNAAKPSTESVSEETTEKETSTEETDTEDADAEETKSELKDQLGNLLNSDKETEETGKDETVYMIADADGTVNKTIVSDWLKNKDNADTLEDASDLKDIKNVKGDETFKQDGDKVTWDAQGNDIFYQGTTDKEAPITQKITYYLDGKEIAPKDLAGKSGKVTMRFEFTNNEKTTKTIDGKSADVYVPFSVVTGMVLNDNFTNVEVTNGKVISDGKNNIVVGITMPGLKESLGIDDADLGDDVQFPDYVEVTADVEDFSLDMTVSMASSNLLSEMNVNGDIDLSVLSDTIDEMTDASDQLVDGSSELSDGLKTLQSSLGEFKAGVGTAQSGVKDYTSGASAVADGANTLNSGIAKLAESAPALTSGVSALKTGVQQAGAGATQINGGVAQLVDGIGTLKSTVNGSLAGMDAYTSSADAQAAFTSALTEYTDASVQYFGVLQQFLSDTGSLYAYVSALQLVDEQSKIYMLDDATNATLLAVTTNLGSAVDFNSLSTAYAAQLQNISAVATKLGTTGGAQALAQVQAGLAQFDDTQLATLKAGAASLDAGLNGDNGIVAGVNTLDSSVNGALSQGITDLTNGAKQLADGANTLVANNDKLNAGMTSLKSATDLLINGVDQLEDGSETLADGMAQFDEQAIEKLADAYNGDLKELLDKVDAVLDAGNEYNTFTRTADGVKGNVKFIWETASIKAED